MKWIIKDVNGTEKIWYSNDVIDKIKENLNSVAFACHCDNCDGCGYYNGCRDTECGTYQAIKCLELLESEDKQ